MLRSKILLICSVGAALSLSPEALAEGPRSLCLFDPAGKSGDYYPLLQDYVLEARAKGVEIRLKPYVDEATAVRDYENGRCDAVMATGVRIAGFNRFSATVEAIGALPTYPLFKELLESIDASPRAAAAMREGEHEVAGIVSLGKVFLFVRDRSVDRVGELAGKRILALHYDSNPDALIRAARGVRVGADLLSFGPKFNNGEAEVCYSSAPGYEPFELGRGLGSRGGIWRTPITQVSAQVVLRHARFPEGFAAWSRPYFTNHFDEFVRVAKRAEARIPGSKWIELSRDAARELDLLLRRTRLALRDDAKTYHPLILGVMRNLRCRRSPERGECADRLE